MPRDSSPSNASPLRVAIAGLGVVGSEVARQLTHRAGDLKAPAPRGFEVIAVSARNLDVDRGFGMDGIAWHNNAAELATRDDVDIVVEMIGGYEGVALELVETALSRGIHVVTANKALLAHHGTALARLAEDSGAALLFEAAIAGGIPAVKALREGLAGNSFSRVSGILNGTCNYILTRMERTGEAFGDVLADAQALGYAEADPSLDVDGIDAAHKLTLLAAIAFGQTPDFGRVSVSGIRNVSSVDFEYAAQLGFRIKLVGVAEPGRMPRMQTCLLPASTQLAKVDGVLNAVAYDGDPVGSTVLTGPGAGAGPTSSAVLSDLIDIANNRVTPTFGRPLDQLADGSKVENGGGSDTPYYVRLMVLDRPGVLADITSILQTHGISVESLLQQGRAPEDVVALVMTTHEVAGEKLAKALAEIEGLSCVQAAPVSMPVLNGDLEG
ncbi:MAG: homoserine dehydrogenase [Rhodospirillaceae bacterium]|nr:homoserine dehydrogenase [Rhodospirillaceae bacterium]